MLSCLRSVLRMHLGGLQQVGFTASFVQSTEAATETPVVNLSAHVWDKKWNTKLLVPFLPCAFFLNFFSDVRRGHSMCSNKALGFHTSFEDSQSPTRSGPFDVLPLEFVFAPESR